MKNVEPTLKTDISDRDLGIISLLLGLVSFYYLTLPPISLFIRALSWQATPCLIQKSEVLQVTYHTISFTGLPSWKLYKINVVYTYRFKGKHYVGNTYNVINFYTPLLVNKTKEINNYPLGKLITCYVNPSYPQESLINLDIKWSFLFVLTPILFLVIGIIKLYRWITING